MTLFVLIVLVVLVSLGQGALASLDWTAGTVIAALVATFMLVTRRL